MTNQNSAPLDFDLNANYLAEVQQEQSGEQVAEGGGDTTPAFDAEAFEVSTLAAVAKANEAVAPTSEVKVKIARIEHDLRGGDRVSLEQLQSVVDNIRNYSPEQKQEVATAIRELEIVRGFRGDGHQKTLEKIAQLENASRPRVD